MITIHRDDLESKLREIESVVNDKGAQARMRSRVVIVGATVVFVGYIAYRIWRGRQQKIRVEVYHQP